MTDEGIDLIWQVTVMRREAASLSLLWPWTQSARNLFVWLLGNSVQAADWCCVYKIDFFAVVLYFIIIIIFKSIVFDVYGYPLLWFLLRLVEAVHSGWEFDQRLQDKEPLQAGGFWLQVMLTSKQKPVFIYTSFTSWTHTAVTKNPMLEWENPKVDWFSCRRLDQKQIDSWSL